MYQNVGIIGAFNERTGYGVHTTNFARELEKLIAVKRNEPGEFNLSIVDSVSIQNIQERLPVPSICYNAWESTEQPAWFIEKLKLFDQLWVVSEWQRACSIAQGIPEEFVKVVPEGVNPDKYFPMQTVQKSTFDFVHVGQWQPRKSTKEIVEAWLKAFPAEQYPDVYLYLSVDTLYPSDEYKSTEERLEAYGLRDSRIVVVHFEEISAYIRRLQDAQCFISCSRAEGWGLPIIESMACGIPTIVADYSGSTEYAGEAIKVRIKELKKPEGIYGGWDVPGFWGEPDYDHLVECLKDVYDNYQDHKKKALATSEVIRRDFSWEAAAKKAYALIEDFFRLHQQVAAEVGESATTPSLSPEQEIRAFARKHGYEIEGLKKRSAIFSIDCWPNSQAKMETLVETLEQVKKYGLPVLITTHYPLPAPITEMADYVIFEKQDIMSGDDKPIYWRRLPDGTVEQKPCTLEYQGVAALNCARNAIDFCRGKWDWMYMLSSDMEMDLDEWFEKIYASDKDFIAIPYEGRKDGIGGGILAGKTAVLDKVYPYLTSWKQYADMYPDDRFVAEKWQYKHITSIFPVENIEWIDFETHNRFDNVDRSVWQDDAFQLNFINGPYFNIAGISNREYEVTFGNSIDGDCYYRLMQKPGMWSRPNLQFYRDWEIRAICQGETKYHYKLDLTGTRVLISFGSKALGDTLAWIPYIEEFRKKHNCHVICSTWWNDILDYPEIEFVRPGATVQDIYAMYGVGCYDNQPDKNPLDWRTVPLQKVASDILGLEYVPLRAKLKYEPGIATDQKYVCFSEFSTMQNKMWNRPLAWTKTVAYLKSLGYDCVSISAEKSTVEGAIYHNGQTIEKTIADIAGCDFYVGLNHGPAWIAYSLGKPVIMLTGVSEPWNDFPNPYRVAIDVGCKPCFNNTDIPINRSWDWCVNEDKYKCTREITEEMVFAKIKEVIDASQG